MVCVVYSTNRKTGNVYAYTSESHRDPETKKVKTKKTYLGRVDPVTKEIIPKAENGKRNRIISTNQREAIVSEIRKEVDDLTAELETVKNELSRVSTQLKSHLEFESNVRIALQKLGQDTV
mgnify:CR=1 FL=1